MNMAQQLPPAAQGQIKPYLWNTDKAGGGPPLGAPGKSGKKQGAKFLRDVWNGLHKLYRIEVALARASKKTSLSRGARDFLFEEVYSEETSHGGISAQRSQSLACSLKC